MTDRVPIDRVTVPVKVTLRILNRDFTPSLTDTTSVEYMEFEKQFRAEVLTVYSKIIGFKDIKIESLRAGSIIVDHNVIVEAENNGNITLTDLYNTIFQEVENALQKLQSNKCSEDSFCMGESNIITRPPPTGEEFCREVIEPGYWEFYSPIFTSNGLFCVSQCSVESPQYLNCNGGDCIMSRRGPKCLCPSTDIYMYIYAQCNGKVHKAVLYGGVGATLAVLLILIVTLGILLCKSRKRTRIPRNVYENMS
ncbi:mucin-3B isoform X1 [Xenopus laevis]|uniref:Mucin-3B isoform X1 n=2 Tax=Xenopus laevis TaxID=8355 RepID=A0A1L8H377_XENLA|nr:mucin-3B isoform X1 [Xenopus laevis]XP_018109232.1 mucin-3B isoform X1 [Xenopus laevis]OCT90550.1 hypothetical protein XELAEV_18019166mg [Xenopus laevis]